MSIFILLKTQITTGLRGNEHELVEDVNPQTLIKLS